MKYCNLYGTKLDNGDMIGAPFPVAMRLGQGESATPLVDGVVPHFREQSSDVRMVVMMSVSRNVVVEQKILCLDFDGSDRVSKTSPGNVVRVEVMLLPQAPLTFVNGVRRCAKSRFAPRTRSLAPLALMDFCTPVRPAPCRRLPLLQQQRFDPLGCVFPSLLWVARSAKRFVCCCLLILMPEILVRFPSCFSNSRSSN